MGFGTPYLIGNNTPSAATTATVTITSNVMSAGDLIVLTIGSSSAGTAIISVTDTQANNYVQIPGAVNNTTVMGAIWAAYESAPLTTTGNAGGPDVITVTFGSATGTKNLSAQGVSVTGGFAQADQVPTPANGTSTSPSVTTAALSSSTEVAFGLIVNTNTGGAPSSLSFTQISQAHGTAEWSTCGYDLTSATTPLTYSGTIVSTGWCALLATWQIVSSKTETFTLTSGTAWLAPDAAGAFTTADVVAIGGGSGGNSSGTVTGAAGGAGGEEAEEPSLAITPGTTYTYAIGAAGAALGSGGNTTFAGDAVTVTAHGGTAGSGSTPGAGGTGSSNTNHHNGGAGGSAGSVGGGGGGGSGGTSAAGNAGTAGNTSTGATAVTGGGPGGNGGATNIVGSAPVSGPGGGGGGGGKATSGARAGGTGFAGQITITVTLTYPAAVPVALASPGQTWRRFFQHPQQQAQFQGFAQGPSFIGSLADAGTSAITPAGSKNATGSLADAGTGAIQVTGSKSATGSLSDSGTGLLVPAGSGNDTPLLPLTAQPGRSWLQRFRQITPPSQFAASLTLPPGSLADAGTGTITVTGYKSATGSLADSGTGIIAPAGAGGDTPVLPPAAQPGPSWRRIFRHRQQPAQFTSVLTEPAGSLADAGTGTIQVTGYKAASGSLADSGTGILAPAGSGNDTPLLPLQAQPGATWRRIFRHRQQPAQFASVLTEPAGSLADAGTGTVTATGYKSASGSLADSGTGLIVPAGSGGDIPVLPPAAQPGRTWRRFFRHPQQPAQFASELTEPAGSLADSGTGTIQVTGSKGATGSLADSGTGNLTGSGFQTFAGSTVPPAQPGATWVRRFRHRQQSAPPATLPPPSFTGSLADAGTGTIQVTGYKAASGATVTTGTGTATAAGSKSATGSLADSGTGILAPAGSGGDTATLPPAAPGRSWLRRFRHRQQPFIATFAKSDPSAASGTGTITATGSKNAAGAVTTSGTGTLTAAGEKAGAGSLADSGTGRISAAGAGADTAVLPPASPGFTWRRFFRHRQQPAQFVTPGAALTGSVIISGTGVITLAAAPVPAVMPYGAVTIAPAGASAAALVIAPAAPGTVTISCAPATVAITPPAGGVPYLIRSPQPQEVPPPGTARISPPPVARP